MKTNPELYLNGNEGDGKKLMREGFGLGLAEAGEKHSEVVVLTADLKESTKVDEFADRFPERFIEVGVAEQNMMGVAAGLALSGKTAVASSYAVFSPGRNWDQLRVGVALSKANVKVVGSHGGVVTGADGASHQGLEDIAITRVLPYMTVISPVDYEQARKATMAMVEYEGPVYLRLVRPESRCFTTTATPFEIGKAQVFKEGEEITVVTTGIMMEEVWKAAEELEGRIDVEIINVHTIKPFDGETIMKSAVKTRKVITVEDHQVIGGLGSAVAEVLAEDPRAAEKGVVMQRIGMKDRFGESGSPKELLAYFRMDSTAIMEAISKMTATYGR